MFWVIVGFSGFFVPKPDLQIQKSDPQTQNFEFENTKYIVITNKYLKFVVVCVFAIHFVITKFDLNKTSTCVSILSLQKSILQDKYLKFDSKK